MVLLTPRSACDHRNGGALHAYALACSASGSRCLASVTWRLSPQVQVHVHSCSLGCLWLRFRSCQRTERPLRGW